LGKDYLFKNYTQKIELEFGDIYKLQKQMCLTQQIEDYVEVWYVYMIINKLKTNRDVFNLLMETLFNKSNDTDFISEGMYIEVSNKMKQIYDGYVEKNKIDCRIDYDNEDIILNISYLSQITDFNPSKEMNEEEYIDMFWSYQKLRRSQISKDYYVSFILEY
jgi:hypothetical protein